MQRTNQEEIKKNVFVDSILFCVFICFFFIAVILRLRVDVPAHAYIYYVWHKHLACEQCTLEQCECKQQYTYAQTSYK